MIRTQLLKFVILTLALIAAPLAAAKEAVIGVSPFGTAQEKLTDAKAIGVHLAAEVAPGETAYVVNAYTLEQIATFEVPNDPDRFKSVQSRMRANRAFFADMKRFADAARAPSSEHFPGQIDFPSFIRAIGANYPATEPRDLILYNVSPLTHDPRTPELSTKGGMVPNDAHITASRAASVYGADGEDQLLTNYTVHWGTNGADWSRADLHTYALQRVLALSISERGAVLATFATDPAAALRNAKAGLSKAVGTYTLKPGDQPAMVPYDAQALTPAPAIMADVPIYERTLSRRVPAPTEASRAENVEIAIRWSCVCDFDLAVQPRGGEAISFRKTNTPEGKLHKDFTTSEDLENGWETVSMPGPVNLRTLTLGINLFKGPGTGAHVEFRIAIAGETWGRHYAVRGAPDGGRGFEQTLERNAPANAAWVVVNPVAILEGR